MLIESSIAQFYDLIPSERFAKMLSRSGVDVSDKLILSAQQKLALLYKPAYEKIKYELWSSKLTQADESPHRMLERNEGKFLWYLWCFCNPTAVYFEIQNTRAGSVSIDFLLQSQSTVLMTDAYSGYERTVREVNADRLKKNQPLLKSGLCNDHSRRYFFQSQEHPLGEKALSVYGKIYKIEHEVQESIAKSKTAEALKLRQSMDPLFNQIYDIACEILMENSSTSLIGKAANK